MINKKQLLVFLIIMSFFILFGCLEPDINTCEPIEKIVEKIVEVPIQCDECVCDYQQSVVYEKKITTYQCLDGTFEDLEENCPKINDQELIKNFDGTNGQVSGKFYLNQGLLIINAKYTGNTNFIVQLINEDGESTYLINNIGEYDGSTSAQIMKSGFYRFQVKLGSRKSGSWQISAMQ